MILSVSPRSRRWLDDGQAGWAAGSKLERVHTNPAALRGDPDDIAEIDWSSPWSPDP